ncbi:hypothetical protein JCM5353_002541, partial [Sporobolomyces roseus]
PLSKTLLPFQRRQLFRSVKVTSYESLENLCTFTHGQAKTYSYIKDLSIGVKWEEVSHAEAKEAKDPGSPSNSIIERFLRQLQNLKTVKIFGSTRITLLFLSPSVTSSLPKLESLNIISTLHSVPNPFNPSHYAGLHHCPELDTLHLHIYCTSQEEIRFTTSPSLNLTSFGSKIRNASLVGPLTTDIDSIQQLISNLSSVFLLSLVDTRHSLYPIHNLLDSLPSAEKLDVLALGNVSQRDPIIEGGFVDHIKALTSLRGLSLISDFALFAPNLYSDIRTLPIMILGFENTAKVSLSQLTTLISGPTKHSTLGCIMLNQLNGKIGTRMEEVGKPYYNSEEDEWQLYPDWVVPEWTEEFSEEGLVEFLEVAKKEGILVKGSAVDAIGITSQSEEEWRLIEDFEDALRQGEISG